MKDKISKTKWVITKKKVKNINHYSFFDNETGLFLIACIYDKNLKKTLKEFKEKNESYTLNF